MKIIFYFDYLSPFAYLAWYQLPQLTNELQLQIEYKPILFAALLNHWGQKGPAEIAAKREYVFTQCLRYATREQIPFTLPKFHPFNPVTCLRLSLSELAGNQQNKIIRILWQAGWQQGKDLGDKDELVNLLNQNGLSGEILLEKTTNPLIKDILKANTADAIKIGVFGVPTFVTENNKIFWGLDSLADLKDFLKGDEKLDEILLKDILSRPSAATRS